MGQKKRQRALRSGEPSSHSSHAPPSPSSEARQPPLSLDGPPGGGDGPLRGSVTERDVLRICRGEGVAEKRKMGGGGQSQFRG